MEDNLKIYTKKDMQKLLFEFLADGCPNYSKDKRGSWLTWFDNYINKINK